MGRPLNKRFFGDGAGRIAVSADVDGSGAEACFITSQRSNSEYRVQTEASFASTALVIGIEYIILTVSGADYTTVGAADNNVGTVFTATGTTAGGTGTVDASRDCLIVDTAPNPGEMRVDVQAENAVTPVQATFTFSTDGGGLVSAVTLVTGGYGYWTNGATFNITVASDAGYVAGTESVVTLTVANGSVVSAVATAGSGYSLSVVSDPIVAGDVLAVDANPPLQYARIINARQVKTFEGNTYDWPITAPLGTPVLNGLTQADLGTQ